jgi:hypothetical protein
MSRYVAVALIAVLSLGLTSPADAQDAGFELTVTHEATASDHAVVVTATTSGADQIGPETINLFLRSDLDDQLRPKPARTGIQVDLVRIDPRTTRAVVALPSVGEWIVLPFADLAAPDLAPLQSADRLPIVSFFVPWSDSSTRIRAPRSSSSWPQLAVVGGGAVVAALIVLALFRVLDRRRSTPSSTA